VANSKSFFGSLGVSGRDYVSWNGTGMRDTPVMQGGKKGMTDVEVRALGELLHAIESRVNRLQEALECRFELPIEEGWLLVSERLAELEAED